MLTLSFPSVARATVHPPSTGPTTSSSGTSTSLKNTSLNSEPPLVMRSGRTSTPSACMSITIGDAFVLRNIGIGAHGREPHAGDVRAARPHLLAVDEPAAFHVLPWS